MVKIKQSQTIGKSMKKVLFLLILFLVITSFSELTAKDSEKSLEFDSSSTLDRSNMDKAPKIVEKNIREIITKDPAKAKTLLAKIEQVTQFLEEAKKLKNAKTAEICEKFANSLKILADYHESKEVSDENLSQAYKDCEYIEKNISQIKLRIAAARRNTPQAKKIRKLKKSARKYLRKSKAASTQGYKAKAEYYKSCAQIKKKMAENPKAEATFKKLLKKAKAKYNNASTKESAIRFRRRATESRKQGDNKKAQYYENVATLKEKLSKAYAGNNKGLIKTLLKEYKKMKNTK